MVLSTVSILVVLFGTLFLNGSLCVQGNNTVLDVDIKAIEIARQRVWNFLNKTENKLVPGLVIGVSVKGEQKWLEGFGQANVENSVTMTGDAVMQIGSISKSFAVALASRLMQENKLDFDAPIRKYLSVQDFPDKTWNGSVVNITLRQLFQMTAGIPNGLDDHQIGKCLHCKRQMEHLIYMRDKELDFEPGTNYTYSNYGYELAGAIIESVLKNKTFDAAVIELIQDILKLNQTGMVDSSVIRPHMSSFYTNSNESLSNSGMWGEVFLWDFHAAGGIVSTMADMLAYGQIWLDAYLGRSEYFLKQSSVKAAWTASSVESYGMGWGIQNVTGERPAADSKVVWHTGGTFGCRSVLAIYPDSETIIAAAANLAECSVEELVIKSNFVDLFTTV